MTGESIINRERTGLLGGTFNPIHHGHIELGLQIKKAFQLDKVLYILAAQPPHKSNLNLAPMEVRWKMLNEALKNFPGLVPCDIEMKRSTMSWTIDTINELKMKNPDTEFFFISGSEGFLKIRTWKDYKTLLLKLPFIVILRNSSHAEAVKKLISDENVEHVYLFSYESDTLAISSTLIREKIKHLQPVNGLVDREVKKIVEEYKLYEP
ncbi:MAG: nicotinate-nucleotide adenylyltransferase [Acidobacteria bacterium]|jgi:nicotinate-nucleotide adenylyltransferase|nr:nicotinate-nucleotide adenylyltransferase [Acidobacteriota bacterium]